MLKDGDTVTFMGESSTVKEVHGTTGCRGCRYEKEFCSSVFTPCMEDTEDGRVRFFILLNTAETERN